MKNEIEIMSQHAKSPVRFTVPSHYCDAEVNGQTSWPDFASAVLAAQSTIRPHEGIYPSMYSRAFVALRMSSVYAGGGGGSDREVLRWEVFRDRVVLVPDGHGGLSDEQKTLAMNTKLTGGF